MTERKQAIPAEGPVPAVHVTAFECFAVIDMVIQFVGYFDPVIF